MSEQWWTDKTTHIGTLNSDLERGVTELHARLVNGEWEYAAISYWYGAASVLWRVANGKLLQGGE